MGLKTGMVMPDGWHYLQEHNGRKVRIDSDDGTARPGLERALTNYRLQNNLPVGNPWLDIVDQVCARYPGWCDAATAATIQAEYFQPKPAGEPRWIDRILEWGAGLMGKPVNYVTAEEAAKRALVCKTCPNNETYENQCPSCTTRAHQLFTVLRQNRDTPMWRKLGGCRALSLCCRAAVWLERDLLPPGAPAECWITKERQG